MSEYTSANMPNRMPERISDYMPDKMPNRTPQRMPDGISEYLPDIMLISECYILYVRLFFFKIGGDHSGRKYFVYGRNFVVTMVGFNPFI